VRGMFWRRFSSGALLITLGVGVVAALVLPPYFLAALLGLIIIWAGFKLICK